MSNTDLYIRDKQSGRVHRIGDDPHDHLAFDEHGVLRYMNLQNGDGCVAGSDRGGYEFVPNTDDCGYNFDPREDELEKQI